MAALINVWHLTDLCGALFQYHHAKMSENVAVPLLKGELLACRFKSDILSLFQTTAKLWQMHSSLTIVNISGFWTKNQHSCIWNHLTTCKIIPCRASVSCQFGLIGLPSVQERLTVFGEWRFTHLNLDIPPQITNEAASVESLRSLLAMLDAVATL